MSARRAMRRPLSSKVLPLAIAAAATLAYACTEGPGFLHAGAQRGAGSGPGSGSAAPTTDGGATWDGASASQDDGGGPQAQSTPASLRARRLTIEEYTNTLSDLLATNAAAYGAVLPVDPVTNGFDDDADSLEVNQLFADEARINAESIAAAFDFSTIGCSPSAGESCARTFLGSFGQKAFRRPLTSDEQTAYVTLFDTLSAASDPTSALRGLLEAMLQSPSFLYRTELGDPAAMASGNAAVPLTPWEIASELSYLFWRTMPDAELQGHAQSGDLTQPSVVAQEVTRLLADPRANRMLDAFADQWLETSLLPLAEKDPATYPTFTSSVAADMAGEVHAFFEASARDPNGSLASMLTSSSSYLTSNLAQFYGATLGSGAQLNGFTPSTMPAGRGGLLTLGAVLATQATPMAGNPVRRGKLVRTQLFCQPIPPPPPNVAAVVPPLDPNTANEQTWEQHSANPACSPCHDLLDPIGFGFDSFDAVGRILPGTIDSTGKITGTPASDTSFDGAVDLEQKLASSPDVQACFVTQWVRFGLGVGDTSASTAEVTRLLGTFPAGGASVQAIVQALTQAPYFYARQAAP